MQQAELNFCYSGRQKLGPSSGDIFSDSSCTLLPIHRKVTLTYQNSFQLQLHLTLCSWAPARVHSTALLSEASLPWAVSLDGTICACLDCMPISSVLGPGLDTLLFGFALGSWAPATGDVSEAVILCSSECLHACNAIVTAHRRPSGKCTSPPGQDSSLK